LRLEQKSALKIKTKEHHYISSLPANSRTRTFFPFDKGKCPKGEGLEKKHKQEQSNSADLYSYPLLRQRTVRPLIGDIWEVQEFAARTEVSFKDKNKSTPLHFSSASKFMNSHDLPF